MLTREKRAREAAEKALAEERQRAEEERQRDAQRAQEERRRADEERQWLLGEIERLSRQLDGRKRGSVGE